MNLPSTPTAGTRQNPRILLLYGAPKVGKTTMLSKLPGCLIIDVENGTDYLTALKVNVKNIAEWKELMVALKAEPMKYPIIAVDTISTLEDWAEQLALQNYRASATGKNFTGSSVLTLANGGGYLWLRLAFKELLDQLSNVTGTIILIAHLREKMLEQAGGKEVAVKDIELTGKLRSIVCSMADAVGYIYRENWVDGKLLITFKSSEQVLCGSRCAHLKGQLFEFDWDKVFVKEASEPVRTNTEFPSNLGMFVPDTTSIK